MVGLFNNYLYFWNCVTMVIVTIVIVTMVMLWNTTKENVPF